MYNRYHYAAQLYPVVDTLCGFQESIESTRAKLELHCSFASWAHVQPLSTSKPSLSAIQPRVSSVVKKGIPDQYSVLSNGVDLSSDAAQLYVPLIKAFQILGSWGMDIALRSEALDCFTFTSGLVSSYNPAL